MVCNMITYDKSKCLVLIIISCVVYGFQCRNTFNVHIGPQHYRCSSRAITQVRWSTAAGTVTAAGGRHLADLRKLPIAPNKGRLQTNYLWVVSASVGCAWQLTAFLKSWRRCSQQQQPGDAVSRRSDNPIVSR